MYAAATAKATVKAKKEITTDTMPNDVASEDSSGGVYYEIRLTTKIYSLCFNYYFFLIIYLQGCTG